MAYKEQVMFGLSGLHLFILLIVLLIIFGPGKLPELGKSIGAAISEFKNSVARKEDPEKPKPDDPGPKSG
jgi:sec-independent protein translocase protein TatA